MDDRPDPPGDALGDDAGGAPRAGRGDDAALRAEVLALRAEVAHLRLQLEVLSATDALTGLLNRAGVTDAVDHSLRRLARTGEPFAVMSVGFDALDETARRGGDDHGRAVAHVAALLTAGLRGLDRVGRGDGTTFLVVLAELTADRAFAVERRLRTIVGAVPLEVDGRELELAPRIGLVAVTGQLELAPGDVVALAEEGRRAATPARAAVVSV